MAPKRSTPPSGDSDYTPGASQSPESPATTRAKRVKTFPKRFKYGIDKQIPGVPTTQPEATRPKAKGIRIEEPSVTPKSKTVDPELAKQKGKEKAHSERPPKATPKKKRGTKVDSSAKEGPSDPQKQSTPIPSEPQPTQPSFISNALSEIYLHTSPPEGFDTTKSTLMGAAGVQFREQYVKKDFCPIVSVDLAKLKLEHNCDLTPWLGPFHSLLSISAPYTPNLVKVFYFNMIYDNVEDVDGSIIEERVTTQVRDTQITISPSIINTILQIPNPPPVPTIKYSNREIFEILRPNEDVPNDQLVHLTFPPVSMPPLHRVLWYIYSRNLIQKGGNFTHFAKKDYPLFATIVDKVPINIGYWIFQEMTRFKFASRTPSHVPFPSLVSVILFYHKVWHLSQTADNDKTPPPFGKNQLNLMRITFDEGSAHSVQQSFARASQARAGAAQSRPTPPSAPADFEEKVKQIVDSAIDHLIDRIDSEVGRLVEQVTKGYNELADTQADLSATLGTIMVTNARLEEKLDRILQHQASTSAAPSSPTFAPSTSPSFTFTTPIIPTPPTSTPTTEVIPPSPTHTEPIPHSPTASASTMPLFEDDKGGEEED